MPFFPIAYTAAEDSITFLSAGIHVRGGFLWTGINALLHWLFAL